MKEKNHSIKLDNLQNGKQTQQAQEQNQTSKSWLNTKIANPMQWQWAQ